jgi:hypothetical protein
VLANRHAAGEVYRPIHFIVRSDPADAISRELKLTCDHYSAQLFEGRLPACLADAAAAESNLPVPLQSGAWPTDQPRQSDEIVPTQTNPPWAHW